jgi:hypothetical protein
MRCVMTLFVLLFMQFQHILIFFPAPVMVGSESESESEFFSDWDPSKSFGFFRIRIRNTAGISTVHSTSLKYKQIF